MGMNTSTLIIIAITVLFTIQGFNNYNLFDRYKFQVGPILRNRQFDRILTSGFLHVNYTHLLFNMLTLYFFAPAAIQYFGTALGRNLSNGVMAFVAVYILSIIGGNLLALLFQKNNFNYSAVGASGGVSGILFATILFNPDLQLYLFFAIPLPGWLFALGYLGYSVYGMKTRLGNIGHEAHLGGSIIGVAAPLIVRPQLFSEHPLFVVAMMVPILLILILVIKENQKR